MKKMLRWVVGLLLVGCGSTVETGVSGFSLAGQGANGSSTSLSGRVLDESGSPLAGVQVVVHERISNAKFSVLSGVDGSFSLNVDPGVYDLGLDRENDPSTATCFYGPLDTAGPLPATMSCAAAVGGAPTACLEESGCSPEFRQANANSIWSLLTLAIVAGPSRRTCPAEPKRTAPSRSA